MSTVYSHIKFDDRWDNIEYGETTLYFTVPKEILDNFFKKGTYPDAVSAEISVAVPMNKFEANVVSVMIAPTRENEYGGTEDYDWTDIDLSYESIEKLFDIAGV